MLEQPFPASMLKEDGPGPAELEAWKEVKAVYAKLGILVYADESVCDYQDVPKLLPFVHGINIKLEKAGGIRGALRTVHAGTECGLKIWFGQMVSSALNAANAAHLLPLATYAGDLDGALLMTDTSQRFAGGFEWTRSGSQVGLVQLGGAPGIGVSRKPTPRMSRDIADITDIVPLQQLNGVPIAELERRARPLRRAPAGDWQYDPEEIARTPDEDEYVEVLRGVRSIVGWLAAEERLKDVLLRDWAAVGQLGLTHLELAAHLRKLVLLCADRAAYGVQYDAGSLPDSRLVGFGPQTVDIRRLVTRGFQHSLFSNLDQGEEDAWCDEYAVRHRDLELEVRLAGNPEHGIIPLIERYGFYEGGGLQNDLRVDPHVVVAVLTGRWNEPARRREVDHVGARLAALRGQQANHDASLVRHRDAVASLTKQLQDLSTSQVRSSPETKHAAYLAGEVDDPTEILRAELEQEEGELLFAKSSLKETAGEIRTLESRLDALRSLTL
eukprot:TRINITY_DN5123_c0_g1_i1.p1 TRINITY_DN5123_c0_g1~~TRINITY_DN5123_c0_g1_i1.p1  ORF type:complete len:498 (+),score=172.10 TRINITY_DN5123_c0_g1_i1:1048-2541(+)